MSAPCPPLRSEILQAGQSPDARRWQGPDFDPPPPELPPVEAVPAPSPPAGPTVAELEAIEAQARDAGYLAGLEQGRKAAEAELQEHRQHIERLFNALARPLEAVDQQVEASLAELAMHIARQVVYRTIKEQPEHILETVSTALRALPLASREIRVHLHPEDAALLDQSPSPRPDMAWQIVPDPHLKRGDVEIDTEMSHLDARVESRLEGIQESVQAEPPQS